MRMGEFVVTVGITAAISIPITYHIASKNNSIDPRETVLNQKAEAGLSRPLATAEPTREQAYGNSIAENAQPKPNPSGKDNEGLTLPELQQESETETQGQASKQENMKISYEESLKQQKEIEQIRKFSESHDGDSHNRALQERYDAEEVDYSWAANRETELLNLFGAEKGLGYAVPESVSCKTSNCQVIVPVSGEQQASSFYRAFSKAVIKNSNDSERPVISYFPGSDDNELILYVSRNGVSDLFEQHQ